MATYEIPDLKLLSGTGVSIAWRKDGIMLQSLPIVCNTCTKRRSKIGETAAHQNARVSKSLTSLVQVAVNRSVHEARSSRRDKRRKASSLRKRMEEMKQELLRGEDKLLKRIREAWENRYAKHLEELSSQHSSDGTSEDTQSEDGSSDEARTLIREAVELKARVKTEFEILQELRSEIEDSESVFDWKARFETIDKENLHLREKLEEMKQQITELERNRQTKDFEISNQRRYYDNRVEELERQIRRLTSSPQTSTFTPSNPLQYSTPMTDKVRQYTALTVISDDEDDDLMNFMSPTPPKPPSRTLPATPLSSSSPKPRPLSLSDRIGREETVSLEDHQRVVEELKIAKDEVSRLRFEAMSDSKRPELTASIERLKEELFMIDEGSQTDLYIPDEMSYSGLRSKLGETDEDATVSMLGSTGFTSAADGGNEPLFPLETLAGVIVESTLNNAVNTMKQVEEAVARERAFVGTRIKPENMEEDDGRQKLMEERLAACRRRLWQKGKKDAALRQDIEDFETLLGLKSFDDSNKLTDSANSSVEHTTSDAKKKDRRHWLAIHWFLGGKRRSNRPSASESRSHTKVSSRRQSRDIATQALNSGEEILRLLEEAETQTVCLACTELQTELMERTEKQVDLMSRISMLEEELAMTRNSAEEKTKQHKNRENELEQHITKLRNLSVKDNEEIDSLIGELDALRQLLDTKQTEFQSRMAAITRANEQKVEQVKMDCRRQVEELKNEKDQELQTVMKNNYNSQNSASDQHQEELVRLRREHAKELDMLDQKYQDEFVDLERHHTDEMLALKKDLEERLTRDFGRMMEENAMEIASLRDRLHEARNAAETQEPSGSDSSESLRQESDQTAVDLMNQLIKYCSALEVKLNNAFLEEDASRQSKYSIIKRLPSFPLRSSSELQPALTESLDVLTELVNKLLATLESTQRHSESLQQRVDSLDRNLDRCGTEAESEHQQLQSLSREFQAQNEELHRAEVLIRKYAEKEGELAKRIGDLEAVSARVNGDLEAANAELEEYRNKESAMDEERSQLQSVRDILSNSMNDSSRVLFEANQSLQDEKSQLENEFGRRFEQLQARRAELEAQVEALEMEMEKRDDAYKTRVDDLEAQIDAMKKQMRSDTKFLEEQTRERESERDKFQNELEQMQTRVKDLSRENGSLRDLIGSLSSSMPPGSPPPCLSPEPDLRDRVRHLEQELEEEQVTSDQLREQIDELLAENARLQVDVLQRRGSTDEEDVDVEDESDEEEEEDKASADSLEIVEKFTKPKRRRGTQTGKQRFVDLDEELTRTKMMRELEGRLHRRRSEDAEARLDDAEHELRRMRHIHEESENDKAELQQQVCTQLGQLSALRQEVDSKRHIQPPSSISTETAEKIEELELETARLRELLASRSQELERLEQEKEMLTEEKQQLLCDLENIRARMQAAEVAHDEVDSQSMSELTQRLLTEKNDEIDGLQARLSHLEETSFTDGERLEDAEGNIHRLNSRLEDREGFIEKFYNEMKDLKKKLHSIMGGDSAAEALRVSANGDGPDGVSSDEEICELNIPGSMDEDDEPVEVMVRQKKDQRKIDYKWAMNGILDEVDTMVDELRLEMQRKDDEVDALKIQESTLEKEVQSLITFQILEPQDEFGSESARQLQEDYDTIQTMLEESQQLRKDLEEFDPQVLKEEFEEKEATLVKELKEAQCLANEREEDLYVLREEKETLESAIGEFVTEMSSLQDDIRDKDAAIERLEEQLESQRSQLEAASRRLQELEQQQSPPQDETITEATCRQQRQERRSDAPEQDSGLSLSIQFPNTPQVEEKKEEERRREEEEERKREMDELRDAVKDKAREVEELQGELEERKREMNDLKEAVDKRGTDVQALNEQLARVETSRERAMTEASIERSERERLSSEKERLERELTGAREEVNCLRIRLNALLHNADEDLDALSSIASSMSPRRSPVEDDDDEEAEVAAVMGRLSRPGDEESGRVPHQLQLVRRPDRSMKHNYDFYAVHIKTLLDRIHKEGVQLLSLSELQYLQTHATVIRHKLDAIRRESGLKSAPNSSQTDPVIEKLQGDWRKEKQALQSANEALKDLLSKLSQTNGLVVGNEARSLHSPPRNRNNNSLSPALQDLDWRQEMIASVERAYKEERNVLLANMRSEVTSAQVSGHHSPEKRLWEVERRLSEAETQQRSALERLYQFDRQSLIDEARSLRRRLYDTEQQLKEIQDKQMALTTSEINTRHENSLRETELAGQLERLKSSFSKLHVELESANRRLDDDESRIINLNAERVEAVRRAEDLERELEERDTRICVLSEQLQQEDRRRQESINNYKGIIKTLADQEQQLHDRLRTQLESERNRSSRLESELKEERSRAIDRARQATITEQELRCQLETEHRRCSDLESGIETERLRICGVQRELEGERALRRSRESEIEVRGAEMSRIVEKERGRAEEAKTELERERRQSRQAREALEEERTSRRQAAHLEADTQAGLASQLEASRTRILHLESALDAERTRLRKLTPRAEEVANALERERAVTGRLQAELAQSKAGRLEAETRADRLQDCLRGLSDEHEAERRRWREQERRCSLELERLSSRLQRSADAAHLSSSRLTSTLRGSTPLRPSYSLEHRRGRSAELVMEPRRQRVLGISSPVDDGHLLSVITTICSSLLALENELDVTRCADTALPAALSSASRHLRHLRQRMENLSTTGAPLYDDHVIRQNCELSRMVVRLAREKEELRAVVCRLEDGVDGAGFPDERLRVPPDGRGPNGGDTPEPRLPVVTSVGSPFTGTPTPSDSGDSNRTQRLYAKYLRSESKRRALVYQKRYLLLLLGGFRECEEAVVAAIANMGVGFSSSSSLHFRLPRPLMKFRAAARVVVATVRMRAMVRRWRKLEEGRSSGERVKNGVGLASVPPGAAVCSRPQSSPNLTSTPSVRPSRPDSLSTPWRDSPIVSNHRYHSPTSTASSPQNEDFLRRLERLQYRVDAFSSPTSNSYTLHPPRYSSVR